MFFILALACAGTPEVLPKVTEAPREELQHDAIYLAMVDRFRDGESTPHDVNPEDPQGWHGGDISGVIQELDRLQNLGIHQVWLTPLTASRQAPFHQWGAYHGYWPLDWTKVESRFGDWGDVSRLREALDARGMTLLLDMVYNHTDFDHPYRESHPHWFHPDQPIENWEDPQEVLTGQVHGLPDLNQGEPEVANYLIDATLLWLEHTRARAIRVDAVRHIGATFIRQLMKSVEEKHAEPVTWIGEIFEGDPVRLAATWEASGVHQVFDFPLYYALMDSVCGTAGPGRLATILSLDRLYPDPNALITFLDNHDLPRLHSRCEAPSQAADAMRLVAGLRGTNSWTWGTEAQLAGEEEPANRASLDPKSRDSRSPGALDDAIAFRAGHAVLRKGLSTLAYLDSETAIWQRTHEGSVALVAFSKTSRDAIRLEDWLHNLSPKASLGELTITQESLVVPQGGSVLVLNDSQESQAVYHALQSNKDRPKMQTVRVFSPSGGLLSGAGPELGNWDPEQALPIPQEGVIIEVPLGTVLSFKRVFRENDQLEWEPGTNRIHWVSSNTSSHTIHLDP